MAGKTIPPETGAEKTNGPGYWDELVEYTAPLLPGSKQQNAYAAVNGETIQIKRGIPVRIKRKFVEAFDNANAQIVESYHNIANIKRQGDKPTAEM